MSKRGFTLIELIVVVAIISVLAVTSYNYYQDSLATARENVVKQNIQMIREAIGRYFQANLRHPDDLGALTPTYLTQSAEQLLVDPLGNATIEVEVPMDSGVTNLLQYAGTFGWVAATQNKTAKKLIRAVRVRVDSGYLIN
ncbi:MAG: putative major pilin subunit [bacterium ADurb.Bin374]|nr:MAG: putative major pilin subunit [bacterium ADurb.Bin374]